MEYSYVTPTEKPVRALTTLPAKVGPVVIVPAHDVEPDADCVPAKARVAYEYAGQRGFAVRLMYARATDPKRGLVDSVSVRLRSPMGEAGWFVWINGSPAGGWTATADGYRRHGVTSFLAFCKDEVYAKPAPAPVVKGSCPRCHREVRVRKDGVPYKHSTEIRTEAGLEKVTCQ